jgi:hypothetical protein
LINQATSVLCNHMKRLQVGVPKQVTIMFAMVVMGVLLGVVLASHGSVSGKSGAVEFKGASDSQSGGVTSDEHSTQTHGVVAPSAAGGVGTSPSASRPAQQIAPAEPVGTPPASGTSAVVAVSASLSDWTAPVSDTRPNSVPGGTVQYRYCTWTYSEGSTKQKLYQDWYHWPGVSSMADPTYDCTVANAPPA